MRVITRARNNHVIERPRSFARIIQADGPSSIRQPCDNPAAKQTLQIDHPIELMRPNSPDTPRQLRPVPNRPQPLALERNDPRQVRIAFQQRGQSPVQPPINLARGQMLLDQTQDRQRLHHVTERTRFEDQNFQELKRSAPLRG